MSNAIKIRGLITRERTGVPPNDAAPVALTW
jgi:hypothetical protein